MIKNAGRFLIKYNKCDVDFVDSFPLELFEEKYQRMKSFFGYENDLPQIKINFVYGVEEFKSLRPGEHAEWMSAFCDDDTTIHVFSPTVISELTLHNSASVVPTIVHEISHFFYGYSKFPDIELFNEGIACYFQKDKCETKINFKIKDFRIKDASFVYNVGHLIIDVVVKEFGEEDAGKKIVEFLKLCESGSDNDKILSNFERVMGQGVNDMLEEHGVVDANNYKEVNNNGKN
jgi:hypothetical protein